MTTSHGGPQINTPRPRVLVLCRLLMEAISLSVHPNDTHPYIELNHEPKNLNPTSYQVVAHFYVGGRGPLPNLHLQVMYL